eukprot:433658_1
MKRYRVPHTPFPFDIHYFFHTLSHTLSLLISPVFIHIPPMVLPVSIMPFDTKFYVDIDLQTNFQVMVHAASLNPVPIVILPSILSHIRRTPPHDHDLLVHGAFVLQ